MGDTSRLTLLDILLRLIYGIIFVNAWGLATYMYQPHDDPSFIRHIRSNLDTAPVGSMLKHFGDNYKILRQGMRARSKKAERERQRKKPLNVQDAFEKMNSNPSLTCVMMSRAQQAQWRPSLQSIGNSKLIRQYQQTKRAIMSIPWQEHGYTKPFVYYTPLDSNKWNVRCAFFGVVVL